MKKNLFIAGALLAIATMFAQPTIYSGDGTLSTNRILTMNGKNLTFKPSNTTSAGFFINGTTGNTGINTVTPTEFLDVNGNVKAKKGLFNNFGTDGFSGTTVDWLKAGLALSAGSVVHTDIGTGALTMYDLGAYGTAAATIWFELNNRDFTSRLRFRAVQGADSQFSIFDKVQGINLQILDNSSNNVQLVMPKADSHIGIGTTSFSDGTDTYALSVKGNVRANRVKVYTTWADFVFEDNYELPTLNEVEVYINDNGHLKDIPSAAEVEAKGIELGEMNKLLLQKVEELTLYMIEQNKVNAQQAQQIEELKVQVKALSEKK